MSKTDFFNPATTTDLARLMFFRLVENDLELRHIPFDAAELHEFVEDVWPLARHEPDAPRWAEAFTRDGEPSSPRGCWTGAAGVQAGPRRAHLDY
jgi:hypothetical protein